LRVTRENLVQVTLLRARGVLGMGGVGIAEVSECKTVSCFGFTPPKLAEDCRESFLPLSRHL